MNNLIVLIEKMGDYYCTHYADGHFDLGYLNIAELQIKDVKGYKVPIIVENQMLFPTMSMKEPECKWVNLKISHSQYHYYNYLVNKYELHSKIDKMYARYIHFIR